MNLVIDAHQHFWQRGHDPFDYDWLESPGNEAICQDFLPADLHPQLQQAFCFTFVFPVSHPQPQHAHRLQQALR